MPDTDPEIRDILADIAAARDALDRAERRLTGQAPTRAASARPAATPPAADSDLDGPYGNPEIKIDPKPKSHYKRLDSGRARGWAKRNASKATGRPAPKAKPDTMNDPDEEVPF